MVFHKDSPIQDWQKPFLRNSPWKHVSIFSQTGPWIQSVNPSKMGIGLDVLYLEADFSYFLDADEYAKLWVKKGASIIKIDVLPTPRGILKRAFSLVPSCISAVKHVMGFHDYSLTPNQFYQSLLAQGGIKVYSS